MEAISDVRDGSTVEIRKGYFTVEAAVLSQNKKCHFPSTKKSFRRQKKGLSVQHTRIYNAWNRCLHISQRTVSEHLTEDLTQMITTDISWNRATAIPLALDGGLR